MDQSSFSFQEIKLIEECLNIGGSVTDIATNICEKFKNLLGKHLSIEQIKQYLVNLDKINANESQVMQERQNVEVNNLFKSFSDNKISSSPPLAGFNNLARPVARRKNSIFFTSKRKIIKKDTSPINKSTWTLQERLDQIQRINEECTYTYDKYERKTNKKISFRQQNGGLSSNIVWFYNEYFYSNYDRKYFESSPMKQIYTQVGFNKNPNQITLGLFKCLQQALPHPRIFNDQFVALEKSKLEEFRNICRVNTKNLSKNNQTNTDFPVHSVVLALHPLCGHLHVGSIMAYYKQNLFMVRFHKPQLPANKILDITMSTQFISLSGNQGQNKGANSNFNQMQKQQQLQSVQSELTQNINYETTGYLIKILAFKNQLVKVMKEINDNSGMRDKKQNVAPDQFQGQQNLTADNASRYSNKELFSWIVNIVKKLDILIKHTLINFRLRGVNQSNQPTIFGNIKNLLLNPLKLMSKQFENSNEQSDISAAHQIKDIISKQRQNQIKKVINNAILQVNHSIDNGSVRSNTYGINKKSRSLDDDDHSMNQQQKDIVQKIEEEPRQNLYSIRNENIILNQKIDKKIQPRMQELLYSCLGVLADLKYEGKDFDYQNNQYLIKLASISGAENSQAFNQIYQRLYSIVNKVRE